MIVEIIEKNLTQNYMSEFFFIVSFVCVVDVLSWNCWSENSVGIQMSARKHKYGEVVCGHYLQNHSFIEGVLVITYYSHLLSIPKMWN